MQGGPLSPLLANIALHGLETNIVQSFRPRRGNRIPPMVVRYADDFVVLHPDLHFIEHCAKATREWLRPLGLELKASKTRITHTLQDVDGNVGFDFLGFNIRQYKVGKTKSGKLGRGELLGFKALIKPSPKAVRRQAKRSPYDGDWIYWVTRLGRSPDVSTRVARLLRKQRGRCIECGLYFRDGETMHIERINPDANRRNAYYNLLLLHRYCRQRRDDANGLAGAYDKR